MNRGLYIATLGMTTEMQKMDVVSNNIANINTTGFKKDGVSTRSFDEELFNKVNDKAANNTGNSVLPIGKMGLGLSVNKVFTNFNEGSLVKTDSPLDLAISGDGMFSVNYVDSNGKTTEKYTKDGSFKLASDGRLLNSDGFQVLGKNGPIKLDPNAFPTINENGDIYNGDTIVDTIKISSFKNNDYLKKFGSNLYDLLPGSTSKDFTGTVQAGYIEASNVNSVTEMVDMISLSRAYEANAKVIQTMDSVMAKQANDVGKKM